MSCRALLIAWLLFASLAGIGVSAARPGPSDPTHATRDAIIGEARESQARLRALAEVGEIRSARSGGQAYALRIMKDSRVLTRVIRFARSRSGILRGRNARGKVTGGTVAAARVNVAGVKRTLFVEGSPYSKPKIARSNNPRYPSRQKHGSTRGHAEQNLAGDIGDAIAEAHGSAASVAGRIHIHVEVPPCSSCRSGAKNTRAARGPLSQLSAEFRNQVLIVTNAVNSEVIVLRGGLEVTRFSAAAKNRGVFASPATDDASSTGSALDSELGGVDFSTLELRYVSDVSSDKTRAAGFAFRARPSRAGSDAKRGRNAAHAFFVWLALPTSAMWVNLNPSEPDRIIEPRFGRTSAGRVLLEADLRMKKTAARLTNPNTRTGRRYWNELDAITGGEVACSSARMWIVPAPATVRETADELYIVKAPLKVKLESDLLGALGSSCGLPVYAKEIEAVSRRLILPRVQRAVRSAPEYAALRSVYMSRVAAEWYRKRADREHGAFAEIVDSGDISRWALKRSWTPRQTFRRYVRSYENGEYKVKRRTRKGNIIYTYTYTSGGVDFADVPRRNVSPRKLLRLRPGLPSRISRALTRPTADPQTGDVWLAGASFDRAAAAKDPVFTGEQAGGGLARPILLLVLCVVILAAAAWSIVRWRTSPARHSRG
jgi:hypothetical protein